MPEAAILWNVERQPANNVIPFVPLRLKKDGTPKHLVRNKQAGVKSEVYAFDAEDAHKILHYFKVHEMWLHYLLFVAQLNIARRNGDMLELKWKNFFNPETGAFRGELLEIREEKTGKFAAPRISQAVCDAINLYIEKTGCNPAENGYENPVFLQLSGTARGKVISYDGCRKAIKKAAKAVGIEYNVGTHSARKTCGKAMLQLHPQDPRALEMVSGFLNHSNTRVTEAYTGRTKEDVNGLVDEVGDWVSRYVVGDEKFAVKSVSPVVSLDSTELRALLQLAYEAGRENAHVTDPMEHVRAFSEIMEMAEQIIK